MIGVVADSAASVEANLLKDENIVVVPMQVEIDGQAHADETVSLDEVIAAVSDDGATKVTTGAPSPGAFAEAISQADQGEGVVVLTVSANMSSSYNSAMLAAGISKTKVEVIDTGTAAAAEGLVVLAAAREAGVGASLEAVVKRAERARDGVRLVAEVGDLTTLARGGRLPARLASLGNAVGLRPVFQFRGGSIRVLRPALKREAALEALVGAWRRTIRAGHQLHVAANYATDRDGATWLLDQVREQVEPATAYVAQFGPVMIAHTGTDLLGLSWWWEAGD